MVRARMALRAADEPMLIRERRAVTVSETNTAFRGMLEPGVMREMKRWPGIPCERTSQWNGI